ncbi:PREDICTED: guanylate-binding protein 4-like, partial [Chrysochloris asiatica]|uniref:Guanylate-binding protein 4-like n=1 Tax=Chrysochloris asiatica TaxID=185453 RepID=A0A9B0U8M8_CHRAS
RNPKIENSNRPRECIRHFFPRRKCFVFDRPTNDKNHLAHIEDVPDELLDRNFLVQAEKFCFYIFSQAKTKTLRQGIIVTGNPVQKATDHYSQQMAQRVRFPTETLQELLDIHATCEKESIAIFLEHSFKDENHEFHKKLMQSIEKMKDDFVLQNEEASVKYCQAELQQLSKVLIQSISGGIFSVPCGHTLYLKARKKVEEDYARVPRKGVK